MTSYDEWAELYDLVHVDINDIPFYLEYAERTGSPILEIACGTGRVLVPLAEAGYVVYGLDLSSAMLMKAKEKKSVLPEQIRKNIHLVQGDMRDFQFNIQFPLILIPSSSFSLLLNSEDQIQTLKNIRKLLTDNGILIIDLLAPKYQYLANDSCQVVKNIINPITNSIIYKTDKMTFDHINQLMVIESTINEYDKNGNIHLYHLSEKLRYIFRYEMEYLLRFLGFKLEATYGTYDWKTYDYNSGKMIFIIRKINLAI